MTPTPSRRFRIHPAIGIARVGNAPTSEFFLGPERPNARIADPEIGTGAPPFKSGGLVKRQAARFRVWEYVERDGVWSPAREVSLDDDDVAAVTWTVHLANRKASFFTFDGLAGSGDVPHVERRNTNVDRRNTLEIDPLPRSIGGRSAPPVDLGRTASPDERWPDPAPDPEITTLGELRTDDVGRLVVVPGSGAVGRWPDAPDISSYANNDGWFDDVGDGPIDAVVTVRSPDGTVTEHEAAGAWLLVGPPDFAPPLPQLVSLYDVLLDVAVRELRIPQDEAVYRTGEGARVAGLATHFTPDSTPSYTVSFDDDVAPILRAAIAVTAVFEPAHAVSGRMGGAGIDEQLWAKLSDPAQPAGVRRSIVSRIRRPAGFDPVETAALAEDFDMPKLLGDDPYNPDPTPARALTVTPTQYKILERWRAGDFVGSRHGPSSLLDPPAPDAVTPHGLDRAATESASGGAFFPGIEVGWLIRDPRLFDAPFRIRAGAPSPYHGDDDERRVTVGAGFFSRQMALPWLADFLQCKGEDEWGWWPSQRPDMVVDASGQRVPWHRADVRGWPQHGRGEPQRDAETPSYQEMVENWWRFGFVAADGPAPVTSWQRYVETERADRIPEG